MINNTPYDLCHTMFELKNTKWYNIITIYKLNKKIKMLTDKIYNQDIFKLSDDMVSFLYAIIKYIELENINANKSNLSLYMDNKKINYNSTYHSVDVCDTNTGQSYNINNTNRIPTNFINDWETICKYLRKLYYDIIVKVSLYLSKKRRDTYE